MHVCGGCAIVAVELAGCSLVFHQFYAATDVHLLSLTQPHVSVVTTSAGANILCTYMSWSFVEWRLCQLSNKLISWI